MEPRGDTRGDTASIAPRVNSEKHPQKNSAIDAMISYAYVIVQAFSNVWNLLSNSISYYVERFLSWLPFGEAVADFVNKFLNNITIDGEPVGGIGLIYIMIGFGLVFYIGYQFITWVLNSVT